MENFETIQISSTSIVSNRFPGTVQSKKSLRRATRVLNRVLRSSGSRDELLRERVSQAVGVINQTGCTETAILQTRPADSLGRIASRVIRRLSTRS